MQSEITPEALENPSFTTKMRGYDPDEVGALLAQAAAALRHHRDTADRAYQVVGEELGELLQQARDRADAMMAAAEKDADNTRAAAEKDARTTRADAEADAARMRAEAEEDSARVRAEAADAAKKTRAAADKDARQMRAEATEAAKKTRDDATRDAEERTARADERVRALEREELAARERIAALRHELTNVGAALGNLEAGPPPQEIETPTHGAASDGVEREDDLRLQAVAEEPAGQNS